MEVVEGTRAAMAMPSPPTPLRTPTRRYGGGSSASIATASSVASRHRALRGKSDVDMTPIDKENRTNNIDTGIPTAMAGPPSGGKFKTPPRTPVALTPAKNSTNMVRDKRPLERIYENTLDAAGNVAKTSYLKGRFLGKGGFATCYEVVCERTSRKYACKMVTKKSLQKPKAKSKFKSEIKIHKALSHPNVVQFERYFEDDENAYILLELCRNQSLSDLLRRRKRLSEAEVRFFVRQLIDGLAYLHENLVIHRDLKLGNLFLTADMKIKIGDFGLAAILDDVNERKRTLCGTPNYIAPEILTGRNSTGHSFEVDVWSTGVVMYTLLVGKPPFETEDVKETYKRIRAGTFSFPADVDVSDSAKAVIRDILQVDPLLRPSLEAIIAYPFFNERPALSSLPKTALLITPPECKRVIASNKRTLDARSYEPPPRYPLRKRDVNSVTDREQPVPTRAKLDSPRTSVNGSHEKTLVLAKSGEESTSPASKRLLSKRSTMSANMSRATTATSETPQPTTVNPVDDEVVPDEKDPFEAVQETLARFFYLADHVEQAEKLDENSSASVIVAAAQRVKEIRLEQEAARTLPLAPAALWLSQWVDYTSKYGMGYVLTDGSSGVYFNDSTKIVSSADAKTLEYMERAAAERSAAPEPFVRIAADSHDAALKKKVMLLSHFKSYLIDEREKKADIAAFDAQVQALAGASKPQRMVYVKKWVKTKHAVLFCLSNGTFQFNFFDASKLLLSQQGQVVSYLDKEAQLHVHSTAVTILNREPGDLAKRLRYARDMFEQIARIQADASE